jgi:O-ureido-D-serine cyclo-ligase
MPVALVSDPVAHTLDEDLAPLRAALAALGIPSEIAFWDDGSVDWAAFDLVVVRSPWDYFRRRGAFLGWAERTAAVTRLMNPVDVLRWNTDKRYLAELEAAGLPITPTTFVEPGARLDAVDLPAGDIVVKPSVSAGSNDTERHPAGERESALAHVRRLVDAGRTAMVQPYMRAVDDAGETALLFFGSAFSHAIRKGPILRDGAVEMVEGLYATEDISPREPTAGERALAERALDAAPGGRSGLLYARVDLVPDADGNPRILEVEMTEPSVFLASARGAAERFAAAIAARRSAAAPAE